MRNEYKNFFYDIKISTPDGKKSARLTDTLLKLCDKVDIMEAVASEEGDGASSLSLSFVEADFLPDDLDKTPAEGVSGRGYITNRTGALIDLRFDTEKGFTYVTPQELSSGNTQSSRTKGNITEDVKFMFSANNEIEVTWGNLEPRVSKTRTYKIGTVSYATGSGGNTLTLQCYTLQNELARIKVDEGITWVDKEGTPLSLKQCVQSIAYVFGARLVFDGEDVPTTILQSYTKPSEYVLERTKVGGDTKISTDGTPAYLLRSQSMDQWLKYLAEQTNSVYEVYQDPILVDIPVIRFTAKSIRFKKVIRTLIYRDPNGIMLDFQFNTISGEISRESSASAVSEDGKASSDVLVAAMSDGTDNQADSKAKQTFDGIPLVYNTRSREILQRNLVGSSVTTPATTKSVVTAQTDKSTEANSFMGFITVKTLGHPDFQPDVMNIQGVGVRASGNYRFFQVQHSLSSAGYTCTMQGKTQESVEQGVDVNSLEKKQEDTLYVDPRLSTGTGG
jgi:hypothetical protein